MRLIDADEATDKITKYCEGCNNYCGVRCGACQVADALDIIEESPTVDAFVCPVKPGQTVYIPYKSVIYGENCGINTEKVDTITFYEASWYAHFPNNQGGFNEAIWMGEVFPTREAAENKLEELKS